MCCHVFIPVQFYVELSTCGTSKFYIAPYGKIKHGLVNPSSNCAVTVINQANESLAFIFTGAMCSLGVPNGNTCIKFDLKSGRVGKIALKANVI